MAGATTTKPKSVPKKPSVVRPKVNANRSSNSVSGGLKRELSAAARVSSPETNVKVSSSSSDQSLSGKIKKAGKRRNTGKHSVVTIRGATNVSASSAPAKTEKKRCPWVTPNSEPLYISFHDEEWGVPVRDDYKLFEILIFSQALSELCWPAILSNREMFRNLFENYDPKSIAKFDEKKILELKSRARNLISEQKLRAVVENARQMLKVIEMFGSFSNYCWRFVNNKPIANGYRYSRQVPIKTPKSEAISKDLMSRGFRCVGPTIIYSFMQASGIVNDHLSSCFRHQSCSYSQSKDCKMSIEKLKLGDGLDKACPVQA